MLTQILPTGENACNFQERSSTMDPDCAAEELSVSMQSCEPFSVTANYPFESLIAPDKSGSELLIGVFNSINIAEPYGHRDDKGKNNAKSADACEMESPNTLCFSPPRRNARITKLNQKTQSRRAVRQCGKRVIKKPLLDSVLLKVARKRRSAFCKPAQSSVWGSLDITQLFKQNIGLGIDQNERTKSRRAQVLQGKQKRNKNQVSASLEKPKAKTHSSTGHIRLKIKLGKGVSQNCQTDKVSLTDNGCENYGANVELAKLTNDNEKKLNDEVHGINGFRCCNGAPENAVMLLDSSHLDACLENKDLENTAIARKPARGYANDHQRVPSQREAEKLGIPVDDKYLDSGTSPDSEVINLTPEAQVNEKVQEDLLDILIPHHGHVGPGDVRSLNLPQKNGKKVKKKDKASHAGVVTVENSFLSPEIISKASPLEKRGQEEKTGDVFYSSDASILTTTANLSSNTSGSEGFSRESLPFSRVTGDGISCEALKVESGTEENLCSKLGVGLQSTESLVSEKKLPSAKTKGRKHVRSSKSIKVSKSGSEVSDLYRSCRGNACRQKGNLVKSIKGKKVKDNVVGDQVVCKVENHPEAGTKKRFDYELASGLMHAYI